MSSHNEREERETMPNEKSLRLNNLFTGLNTIFALLIVAAIGWAGNELIGIKTSVAAFTYQIQTGVAEDARLQKEIDRDQAILDEHGKRIQSLELRDNIRRQP